VDCAKAELNCIEYVLNMPSTPFCECALYALLPVKLSDLTSILFEILQKSLAKYEDHVMLVACSQGLGREYGQEGFRSNVEG
jgi:hypothetical protein